MTHRPRWFTDHGENYSHAYIARLRKMAAEGSDLAGEARLLDALVEPGSRLLDAGCGPGRVGAVLFDRGHDVVGVDIDDRLIAAADEDHPGPTWLVGDLSELDLAALGEPAPFDAAVVAGNVLPYLAPGTESAVLERITAHLKPDGILAVGFGLDRGYSLTDFDAHCANSGLIREHRFATWDLRPWRSGEAYAVTVLRRAQE
ncbi:MAG: SAM-dependent methyltransferase [Pseudonocardiales bacterium]|nr:MAG: SAM-dependent methyltransferase [Pseudonocardiales bacterium]